MGKTWSALLELEPVLLTEPRGILGNAKAFSCSLGIFP